MLWFKNLINDHFKPQRIHLVHTLFISR